VKFQKRLGTRLEQYINNYNTREIFILIVMGEEIWVGLCGLANNGVTGHTI